MYLPSGEMRDVGHAVRRIAHELRFLLRRDIERPEALQRRRGIARLDGELLVVARALVAIDRVGRHEVDLRAVGRELPRADARGVTRPLRRRAARRRPELGDVERVDLLVVAAARRVDDRLSVFGELELRHAFARVGHALGFTAVEAHDEKLIATAAPTRAAATATATAATSAAGAAPVASRSERNATNDPSLRPARIRLVLVLGERELARARQAAIGRHQIDVGLPARLIPIRGADGVEHHAAVGTQVWTRGLAHVLNVEKGDWALRLRAERCGGEKRDEGLANHGCLRVGRRHLTW